MSLTTTKGREMWKETDIFMPLSQVLKLWKIDIFALSKCLNLFGCIEVKMFILKLYVKACSNKCCTQVLYKKDCLLWPSKHGKTYSVQAIIELIWKSILPQWRQLIIFKLKVEKRTTTTIFAVFKVFLFSPIDKFVRRLVFF